MTKLEEIVAGTSVRGIVPEQTVEIVSREWIGDQALDIVYRCADGALAGAILYREDEGRLGVEVAVRKWSFDAENDNDAAMLRLTTEANRIKLAHYFDPYLAMHSSQIDPLPHQITAVYEEMLPRHPLRFLLADDPGAGKTVMTGLLIKALRARSDLERCLVIAPGNLVEQWQDELAQKFDLEFDVLTRGHIATSRSGNVFADHNHLIARLDVLARDESVQRQLLKGPEWDLIVCDEAHRMSASYVGNEVKFTKRYHLGQHLGKKCRHLLLLTATPHNGREEDFQLFMALLDSDRFEGRFRDGVHHSDTSDMMRRLTKEDLLRFDGKPLFPERRAYTAKYDLSPEEMRLYDAVTKYVRTEMNRVRRFTTTTIDARKRNNISFALQILQRRLASSPAAIHASLCRRRQRLEEQLSQARSTSRMHFEADLASTDDLYDVEEDDIEEYEQNERDALEERVSTAATAAQTVEQLQIEVATLQELEQQSAQLLHSGSDAKWAELTRILNDDLMRDAQGERRKLIVFTESRDTLEYLHKRVCERLGNPHFVTVIHGAVRREQRRERIERFMNDKHLLVLIANDAAGEGVNLQRAHLMVNYDLPWNPNRIEQRFGRIHRIGQTQICHLWNLVAADTREGEVYARLLEKLESAGKALGGRVYNVLGRLFEGVSLRDLLLEAIEYGEQPQVRERLFQQVDNAADRKHLQDLLERHALSDDDMPAAQVHKLRLDMEQAEAQRLQPHHIQGFFLEAFKHLGGRTSRREPGRWEITHVPYALRDRNQSRYQRICFDREHVNQQPVAAFICPGHPLLEAVISTICDRYDHLLQRGAIFVDDSDDGDQPSALFLLRHAVVDSGGRNGELLDINAQPHTISEKMHFASLSRDGSVVDAGIAPHLNLRPATAEECELVADLLDEDWLRADLEKSVNRFATLKLARTHVAEVQKRYLPELDKVAEQVRTRLQKEINHWDARATELREAERAGKRTRLNWQNARDRAEKLTQRLHRRMKSLENQRFLSSRPPRICGGMLVVPKGLLESRRAAAAPDAAAPAGFAEDAASRREIERAAMQSVMDAERALGNEPQDVSASKWGYDILSFDPQADRYRFIEVKGRISGADTVMLTRNEIITSLNEREKYILALVEVAEGFAHAPRYVHGALDDHEPRFDQSAIQCKLPELLKRACPPGANHLLDRSDSMLRTARESHSDDNTPKE